jgi:hypothetical protein
MSNPHVRAARAMNAENLRKSCYGKPRAGAARAMQLFSYSQ